MAIPIALIFLILFNPFIMWFLHLGLLMIWSWQYQFLGVDARILIEFGLFALIYFSIAGWFWRGLKQPLKPDGDFLIMLRNTPRMLRGTLALTVLGSIAALAMALCLDLAVIIRNLFTPWDVDLGFVRVHATFCWILLLAASFKTLGAAFGKPPAIRPDEPEAPPEPAPRQPERPPAPRVVTPPAPAPQEPAPETAPPGEPESPETEPAEPPPQPAGSASRDYVWLFTPRSYECFGGEDEIRLTVDWDPEVYEEFKRRARVGFDDWALEYVSRGTTGEIMRLAEKMSGIKQRRGYDELTGINLVLSWVQQIAYNLDEKTVGQPEYPRYPVETIKENQGDCEDKSFLAAAVLRKMGYDTVLLHSPGHISIGVAGADCIPVISGSFVEYQGKKYYFCETTADGWFVGELPPEIKSCEVIPIPLSVEA